MNSLRLATFTVFTVAALALPAGALASPTASQITTPGDPSFVRAEAESPVSLHVAGTTSGGAGDVDLRCYYGTTSDLVAAGVPVTNGAFASDVPVTTMLTSTQGHYCVLRAVPALTTPTAPANQASPFQGPHVGWGSTSTWRLGAAAGPNPPATLDDAGALQAQPRAYSAYYSAGDCGICETSLFEPATLAVSNQMWYAGSALFSGISGANPTRSAVKIDGVDAYSPAAASDFAHVLMDNPGYPALSYTSSVDPANGDLTTNESDPYVTCTPQPAAYPASDLTCPAFAAPVVTLDRTVVQNHEGLQTKIVDHWRSTDGQTHQLDAVYADENAAINYYIPGHQDLHDFSWTGAGFTTYPDGTDLPAPAGAPATVYVKTDSTTPDNGDNTNPFGAVTYGTAPTSARWEYGSGQAHGSHSFWDVGYQRTIPASGDLVITTVYSHDFSLASVQSLAHEAEQALTTAPAPGAASDAGAPAASTATPAAAKVPVVKCKVPKLRGRTLRTAKRLLVRNHCRLGKVTRKATARMRAGRVLVTKPRAGSKRPRGTRIAVRLAKRA